MRGCAGIPIFTCSSRIFSIAPVVNLFVPPPAKTLSGRIPLLTGRIPNEGLVVMVSGDERLRRPFVVAVANPSKISDARVELARRLAAYLRTPQTQQWIADFGKGRYDAR